MQSRYNLPLPEWTTGYFPDKMKELSDFSASMAAYTTEMQRLRGGKSQFIFFYKIKRRQRTINQNSVDQVHW